MLPSKLVSLYIPLQVSAARFPPYSFQWWTSLRGILVDHVCPWHVWKLCAKNHQKPWAAHPQKWQIVWKSLEVVFRNLYLISLSWFWAPSVLKIDHQMNHRGCYSARSSSIGTFFSAFFALLELFSPSKPALRTRHSAPRRSPENGCHWRSQGKLDEANII